ncbi:MAG: GYF domain-containing protein [Phycisphaerae bacterium]|nr:GYF domain-containing protein [Phycisphaerae bacterium]
MKDWHCVIGGQKYGPINESELRQWVRQSRLGARDLVWTEGMDEWKPVADVAGLADALPASQVIAATPFAQNPAGTQGGVMPGAQPGMPGASLYRPGYQRPLLNAPGAVTSMVCGIVGLFIPCIGLVLGIIAIVTSNGARLRIRQRPDLYTGGGMATAGLVLGIIDVVFWSLWSIGMIGNMAALSAC